MTANRGPVLVAEDDPQLLLLQKRLLSEMNLGVPVITMSDGESALEYLERTVRAAEPAPTLLVLDENMPGRTGREVLRWCHEQPAMRGVPIIMLTGAAIASDIDVVLDTTFVLKPLTSQRLREVLDDLGLIGDK